MSILGIKTLVHLHLGKQACFNAAYYGSIGYIQESCKGEKSCYKAAYGDGYKMPGNITSIKSSCKGEYSCYKGASEGGFINGIDNACLTDSSCYYAAYNGAEITSGIKNCVCDSCAGVLDAASLPDECGEKGSSGKSSKSAKSANTAAETALELEGQVEWEDTLAGALEDFSMKVKVDEPKN